MNVAIIVVYFGTLPPWIDYFVYSCAFNRDIDWFVFTDQTNVPAAPANVKFLPLSQNAFRSCVIETLGIETGILSARKVCDFRPTFGVLFEEWLAGFDFWGHCDVDVIFGDLRLLLSDHNLAKYDIISSRMERHMSGHLSLYRNCDILNNAFRRYQDYDRILSTPQHFGFDEAERNNDAPGGITRVLRSMETSNEILPLWEENAVSYPPDIAKRRMRLLGRHPGILSPDDYWLWIKGKLYFMGNMSMPVPYLHFKNWKDKPEFCRILPPTSDKFVVRIDGIANC
jgi:hypothetical protein